MRCIVLGVLFAALGCGSTTFLKTGKAMPPKAESCEFEMFTAEVDGAYEEIGLVDVNPGAAGANTFRELSAFKNEIRPLVCRAGGDAAIAYANAFGYYTKASVLKRAMADARPR